MTLEGSIGGICNLVSIDDSPAWRAGEEMLADLNGVPATPVMSAPDETGESLKPYLNDGSGGFSIRIVVGTEQNYPQAVVLETGTTAEYQSWSLETLFRSKSISMKSLRS